MTYKLVTYILKEMPINCPICKGPLVNTFKEYPKGNTYAMDKTCFKSGHSFYCASTKGKEDEVAFICISLDPYKKVSANWIIPEKKLYIYGNENVDNTKDNSHLKTTYIPYVEPDFTDPVKLLNKIRLYCKLL
jgi:hypothetical protein